MQIHLEHISKRFGRQWVIREFSHRFPATGAVAVTGANGSGKSTLLKIVSGGLAPTSGTVHYTGADGKAVYWSDAARYIGFCAPYIELFEKLTLEEHLRFHFGFLKPLDGMDEGAILRAIDLEAHRHKFVRDFSSGMKQRFKLALAFYTDQPVLLLDEPTSNLDDRWTAWYRERAKEQAARRLLVIASNNAHEYDFCGEEVRM